MLSKIRRPASQVEFVPFLSSGIPSPSLPALLGSIVRAFGSRISTSSPLPRVPSWRSDYDHYYHPVSKISPNVQEFLKQNPVQPALAQFLSHPPWSNPSLEFILSDFIGQGRTGKVWHASLRGSGTSKPLGSQSDQRERTGVSCKRDTILPVRFPGVNSSTICAAVLWYVCFVRRRMVCYRTRTRRQTSSKHRRYLCPIR